MQRRHKLIASQHIQMKGTCCADQVHKFMVWLHRDGDLMGMCSLGSVSDSCLHDRVALMT